ncbi:Uncharacterised protein [Salmonella enterica subsp. enterica]|nr:Uncharacterised protein [Salmonella enterica subsp. enterica]
MCGNVFQLRHNQRRVLAAHLVQVWHGNAQTCRRGVHREVETRFNDRGRHQRHHCNKGLHQHRAVADKTRIGLTGQQFRCGAGRDERVEARDGATGDGDEQEREQSAFPQRAGTVDILRQRRHFQFWVEDHNPQRQTDDHADFQEGSEIVARGEDQPYRQQRGNKGVADQREGNGGVFKGQRRAPVRVVGNHAAEVNRRHQQHDTNNGDFAYASRTQEAHVDAHKQRNRHRGADGEDAPRAFGQRFNHD